MKYTKFIKEVIKHFDFLEKDFHYELFSKNGGAKSLIP